LASGIRKHCKELVYCTMKYTGARSSEHLQRTQFVVQAGRLEVEV
jgi:hypothetical protein